MTDLNSRLPAVEIAKRRMHAVMKRAATVALGVHLVVITLIFAVAWAFAKLGMAIGTAAVSGNGSRTFRWGVS